MSLFLQVGKTKRIAVRSVRNETVLAHTIDGRENLSVQRDDSARGIPNEFAFGFFRLYVSWYLLPESVSLTVAVPWSGQGRIPE